MSDHLKKIDKILDNINSSNYFLKYKKEIADILSDPKSNDILIEKIKEGRRYSLLMLIDKMELIFDDSLYLNFFKYKENQNPHLYMIFFQMYVKKLISKEGLEKIRNEFFCEGKKEMFLDCEKKIVAKQMETDRYFYKKLVSQKQRISDTRAEREAYLRSCGVLKRSDMSCIAGINLDVKKVIIINLTNFFVFDQNGIAELISKRIKYLAKTQFEDAEYQNVFLSTLNMEFIEEKNADMLKKNKVCEQIEKNARIKMFIDKYIQNFFKCKETFSYWKDIYDINSEFENKFFELNKNVKILRNRGFCVYIISENALKFILSEIVVLGLNEIDYKNVISYRNLKLNDVVMKIYKKENVKFIKFFGSLTEKLENDVCKFIHHEEKIENVAKEIRRINQIFK